MGRRFSRALVFSALAFAGLSLLVGAVFWAPNYIKDRAIAELVGVCPQCSLQIDNARLAFFPFRFKLEGVSFEAGKKATTHVAINAHKVEIHPSTSMKSIPVVDIMRPNVVVTEGDEVPVRRRNYGPSESPIQFGAVRVTGGRFSYIRAHGRKRAATIRVGAIDAAIDDLTLPPAAKPATASAKGLLEDSAPFSLSVSTAKAAAEYQVDVRLRIEKLDLKKLRYFYDDGKIGLSGRLEAGSSAVFIRGRKATAEVEAQYHDLAVTIDANEDRGGFLAGLMELVAYAQIAPENTKEPRADRIQRVNLTRTTEPSIVAFIFAAMKEAAVAVSTASD